MREEEGDNTIVLKERLTVIHHPQRNFETKAEAGRRVSRGWYNAMLYQEEHVYKNGKRTKEMLTVIDLIIP